MKRSQNSSFTFLSHKSLIFIPESRKKDTWKYLIIVRFIQHALCLFMQACKRHFSCIRKLREMKKRRTRLRCLLPLHKPCSVLSCESGSHLLRVSTFRSLASFRRDQIPLPNLGFSLAGFTRSIFPVSRKARLCGTFKGVRHSFHHRPSPAVSLRCLDLSFHPAQTLHPSQNVRAWTFL